MIISTVGSHSALQILYGAKQEGFKTRVYVLNGREELYRRFPVADEIVTLDSYEDLLNVEDNQTIFIPHGTIIATLGEKALDIPLKMFGNREAMRWEMKRELNLKLLKESNIPTPKVFTSPEQINELVIVKFPGAKGGLGYFLCSSYEEFEKKSAKYLKAGIISKEELEHAQIQEYVVGVTMYPHYFYSPLLNRVEFLGIDRRYETNVDALGRLAFSEIQIAPSYKVVGNIPLIARESLLYDLIKYGDRLKEHSNELFPPGLIGPYCLELAITPEKIIAFEFTSRIVAGTSLYISGSPYSWLLFNEEMSMGRRIARELKNAQKSGKLELVIS